MINESVSNEEGEGITIVLSYKANQEKKIEKTKINGIENHWIRCRFQPYNDKWNFTDIDKDRIPAITKITAKVEMDAENSSDSPEKEKSPQPPPSLKTPSEKTE